MPCICSSVHVTWEIDVAGCGAVSSYCSSRQNQFLLRGGDWRLHGNRRHGGWSQRLSDLGVKTTPSANGAASRRKTATQGKTSLWGEGSETRLEYFEAFLWLIAPRPQYHKIPTSWKNRGFNRVNVANMLTSVVKYGIRRIKLWNDQL